MEDNKLKTFFKKMGLRFMSTVSNKSIEQLEMEMKAREIVNKMNEEFSNLIIRLRTEQLTKEEIDYIVKKCESMKQNVLKELDKMLNSDELEDKEEIENLRKETLENADANIKEAKEIALGNMKKPENDIIEENKGLDTINLDSPEENTNNTISPFAAFGVDQKKAQTMTAVPDDAPTAIPVKEPEKDMELEEPELEMPELEEPEIEDSEDTISEPEIDEENIETELEEPVIENEEPAVSEGIDITDEMTSDNNEIDITQCSDWYEYVALYFEKSGIDDVHGFYKNIDKGNYPLGFLDKKSFAIEKQRIEDEIEYKKLETERAETEKRLREIEEKQAALSEEHTELQARFADRDAKLAALRKDNVSLKQELVDKAGEIKDKTQEITGLQRQLTTAQEVAKKAQAKSYEDRKALSEIEKQLSKEKAHAKELERKLQASEKESAETKRELEATRARITENTEAALKQINSLRTTSDDDIEKTALDWAEKQIKETPKKKEEKKGPKHFAEKKPKHVAPKEETKVEEKIDTPVFEMPKPEETKEPVFEPEKELETVEEPQVIGVSTTPDVEFQGTVTQDKDGHINFETKPLKEIEAEKADLEAKKADLVSQIEKEAEENTNSEGTKTR